MRVLHNHGVISIIRNIECIPHNPASHRKATAYGHPFSWSQMLVDPGISLRLDAVYSCGQEF